MNRSDCPNDPEDVAEKYCMNALQQTDREAFEQHVLDCQSCSGVLRDTKTYIDAMRSAAQKIREREKSD
jgi:hypothetical protein